MLVSATTFLWRVRSMGRAAILPLIWFSRRLAAVVVIEEASYVREKNNTKYSRA